MKRKIFSWAVIVICLSLIGFGTLAYFTAGDVAHNVITSGDIDIEINEWADANKTVAFPEDGVIGVMPGAAVTKIVEVKNTGHNDAYVRVSVEQMIELASGDKDQAANSPLRIDFNNAAWTLGDDGYYYYNEALKAGETTAPLFTTVRFDKDMGNEYQNSTAKIDVKAYAVQVANNGSSVAEAAGWPDGE